ncbi:phosphate uptake regulator PhoU, partial [Sulfolobus sp. F1]
EGYNIAQLVDIYSVAKVIERVADHADRIATLAEDVSKFSKKDELTNLGYNILDTYKTSMNAFLNGKKDVSHDLISNINIFKQLAEMQESAIKSNDSPKIVTSTSMVIESLRRIARYSSDIAEATIDMLAKSGK